VATTKGAALDLCDSEGESQNIQAVRRAELIGASLKWKRAGAGWRLFDGRRRFGDVVPDGKHPGMWRSVMSGGRLSDMANMSWARNAVLEAATRELAYEARHGEATDPTNCPVNEGVFGGTASPMRLNARRVPGDSFSSRNEIKRKRA
jgi:hypothetical protein